MIKESDFLALIEAAADLADLRNSRYFVLRSAIERKQFASILRAREVNGDLASTTKGWKALEKWASSGTSQGLRLRNPAKLPEWAKSVRRMLSDFPRTKPRQQGALSQRFAKFGTAYGRAELQRRLKRREGYPFSTSVLRCFEKQLENLLADALRSCLEFDLKAFEAAIRCVFPVRGDLLRTQVEREFIGERASERLIALFQNHPALAKLWAHLIGAWVEKVVELASRLRKDFHALRQTFFKGRNPGVLVDVTLNISDPHRGGRETIILGFRGGRVVYKPRSGQGEDEWFSFVRWVNQRGFEPGLRAVELLRRRNYYWAEFIEPSVCVTQEEVHRYYRRGGGLLCAAFLFGAVDCHRDNLIAAGDHPVLIDAETLFHPEGDLSSPEKDRSITRTGLLPTRESSLPVSGELAALGGAVGKHTPTLRGRYLSALDYWADVVQGFRDMWMLIGNPRAQAAEAFRRRLHRLAGRPWRRIYRSSKLYHDIRTESLAARALKSGLDRSQTIARALVRHRTNVPITLEEISAIERFDIPCFLETPCETFLGARAGTLSGLLSGVRSALRAPPN